MRRHRKTSSSYQMLRAAERGGVGLMTLNGLWKVLVNLTKEALMQKQTGPRVVEQGGSTTIISGKMAAEVKTAGTDTQGGESGIGTQNLSR
ncbi:hypothetical protein DH86_00003409 [Scytalidium sp. 3C]|nr:hypothetical protein DH86_00003409 [Scytalidium sp. 3C]